jgi:RNA-directed DNA polymerase
MFTRQVRYLHRTHPNKSWHWLKRQYFGTVKERADKWVFQDKSSKIYLDKLSWIPIRRHIMVKNVSSPDNPKLRSYWLERQRNKQTMTTAIKRLLWHKQQGKCPRCLDIIDNGEQIHVHHLIPRSLGGRNNLANLSLLHAMCHRQIHSRQGRAVA